MADEDTKEKGGEKVDSKMTSILKSCHLNPNLIMLKLTLFVMYGATASLLPYLTIHMQSIGLTVEEIAIVYLALPFTTFLSPPVTGYLVDKFGKYKPVVVLSLILNAVFHHSLLLIPHMETPGETPSAYVMRHPLTGDVEVWWSPCPSRECPEEEELDMVLAACADHCLLAQSPRASGPAGLVAARQSKLSKPLAPSPPITSTITSANKSPDTSPSAVTSKECKCADEKTSKKQKDLHFLFDAGKKKSRHGSKKHKKTGPATGLGVKEQTSPNDSAFFLLDMHPDLGEPTEQLGMEMPEPDENETISDFKHMFGEELLAKARVNVTALEEDDLRCGGLVLATNLTYNTLRELAADCMLQKCTFSAGGPEVCPPEYMESDDRVFWIYFLLRFAGTTMLSAGVTMLDPIALTMIQTYGGEFGRERLFSIVGMAIFSPLTGLLIDRNSKQLGYTDYSAAFYTYDILLAISAVTVALMPLGDKMPADHILRDLLRIIRLPHVILFIVFLFILGNFWGFIESFLFLYLKEIGAPNYLLGITVTVGTLSSMPFLYGAEKITRKFGHVNIIVIAFFSHAARLIGYSFIESPWWCFPFEAIEALAVHLMWVAAATYCALLAPKNLLATLIGVLGMVHFSLGRGSGSFVGGLMIGTVGTRESFTYMGGLAIVSGVAYGLLHFFWLHKYEMRSRWGREQAGQCVQLHCDVHVDADAHADAHAAADAAADADEDVGGAGDGSSAERISLVIEMNRGSLASLEVDNNREIANREIANRELANREIANRALANRERANREFASRELVKMRHRTGSNIELRTIDHELCTARSQGNASNKIDLLKSDIEVNLFQKDREINKPNYLSARSDKHAEDTKLLLKNTSKQLKIVAKAREQK